jgi:hypothetical protein
VSQLHRGNDIGETVTIYNTLLYVIHYFEYPKCRGSGDIELFEELECSEMQWDAVWCSEMQWDAVRCSEMQWDAVRCSEMQWDAVRCSEMQVERDWDCVSIVSYFAGQSPGVFAGVNLLNCKVNCWVKSLINDTYRVRVTNKVITPVQQFQFYYSIYW